MEDNEMEDNEILQNSQEDLEKIIRDFKRLQTFSLPKEATILINFKKKIEKIYKKIEIAVNSFKNDNNESKFRNFVRKEKKNAMNMYESLIEFLTKEKSIIIPPAVWHMYIRVIGLILFFSIRTENRTKFFTEFKALKARTRSLRKAEEVLIEPEQLKKINYIYKESMRNINTKDPLKENIIEEILKNIE